MIPSMENFNYKKNEKILIKFFEKIEKKRYKKKDLRLFNLKKLDYRLGQSYIYKNQNWNIDSILKFMKFANNRELIQICKYEIPEKKMEKKRKFYTKQSKSVSPIRTASRLFQEFKVIIKWFYFGLLKHR